ncbi:DUF4399 domain-containing protein [Aliikangiella coralliicola]|uniref:DUF4399 domain-containing protein n=1 Tax=Aliikangiella coralliicola TaxID=2592383 RepID=A0A545U6B3_9GAMM|nr:DUF4399 domain-containing protein [Aliikangiella coralliicola]TQV85006.1 DUF4399 domain-containing protein [Aliikangiella coralliicola]
MNNKRLFLLLISIISSIGFVSADSQKKRNTVSNTEITKSPENAKVYIIEPKNGEEVSTTFTVRFGLSGMGVAPAGVDKPNTGHHHLLIDANSLPAHGVPMGGEVMHFGGGQTEVELTLTKGKHTLQLILGDKLHIPHEPMVVSEQIMVIVK